MAAERWRRPLQEAGRHARRRAVGPVLTQLMRPLQKVRQHRTFSRNPLQSKSALATGAPACDWLCCGARQSMGSGGIPVVTRPALRKTDLLQCLRFHARPKWRFQQHICLFSLLCSGGRLSPSPNRVAFNVGLTILVHGQPCCLKGSCHPLNDGGFVCCRFR